MKKAAVSATVGLSLAASGALAIDWTVRANLGEYAGGGSNFVSTGPAIESISALGLDAIGRTPDWRIDLNGRLSYVTYAGGGATGLESAFTDYGHVGFQKTGESTSYTASATITTRELRIAQLAETGIVNGTGLITTELAQVGVSRALTPVDSLSLAAVATSITYSNDNDGAPFTGVFFTGDWVHRVNSRTDLITDFQYQHISIGAAPTNQNDASQLSLVRGTESLKADISGRLNFKGTAGLIFGEGSSSMPINLPSGTVSQASAVSWVADVVTTYKLLQNTSLSLFAGRNIGPTLTGALSKFESVGATLNQRIDEWSNVRFSARFSDVTQGQGQIANISQIANTGQVLANYESFTASAAYTYRLSPEWNTSLTYIYRNNLTTNNSAINGISNGIFLTLNYSAILFGDDRGVNAASATPRATPALQGLGVSPGIPSLGAIGGLSGGLY